MGSIVLNSCFVRVKNSGDVRLAVFSLKSRNISTLYELLLDYYCKTSQIHKFIVTAHRGHWKFGANGILYSETHNLVINIDNVISSMQCFDDIIKKYIMTKISRENIIEFVGEDPYYPTTFMKKICYKEKQPYDRPCNVHVYAGVYLQPDYCYNDPTSCLPFVK